MIKLVYRLVSLLAGVLAGAIVRRLGQFAACQDDALEAADARRGWLEILAAAALQAAACAVVKAVGGRGAAEGARKLTGAWPGENGEQASKAG